MREVKPPVNFKNLEIDGNDTVAVTHRHNRTKRTNTLLTSIIVILSILGILAGGFGLYRALLDMGTVSDNNSLENYTPPSSSSVTAQSLIAKTKVVIGSDIDSERQSIAPLFKPAGYNFSVRPSVDYGYTSFGTQSTIANDIVYIQKIMIDNDMSETVLEPGTATSQLVATYQSATVTCLLTDQKPFDAALENEQFSVSISCANKSDYVDGAAGLRQYFIVYSTYPGVDATDIALSGPTIKQSKTSGFSTATVGISGSSYDAVGGFAGLFYATPDGTLHYFTGTQSILPCSAYDSTDIKKAFLGEQCYDEVTGNDAATVKL